MESSPDLSIEDIAPLLGQQMLEIIALRKEVQRLRARMAELEAALDAKRYVDGIAGTPV